MKYYISIFIMGNLFFSCNSNLSEEIEVPKDHFLYSFFEESENLSLNQIEKEINNNIESIEKVINFYEIGSSLSKDSRDPVIKRFTKDEEIYEEPFGIDTVGLNKALDQFKNVMMLQAYKDYKSEVDFFFGNDRKNSLVALGSNIKQIFNPSSIYYRDGTVDNNIVNREKESNISQVWGRNVLFNFDYDWNKPKYIDSVFIDYIIEYPIGLDSIILTKDRSIKKYKEGEIQLKKIENNYIYLTLSDSITNVVKIETLNKEGKVLKNNYSKSSNRSLNEDKEKDFLKDFLRYLKEIQSKIQSDKFDSTKELLSYMKRNLDDLDLKDTDGVYHIEKYCKGEVSSVKLFYNKGLKKKKSSFKAKNVTYPDNFIKMNVGDSLLSFINLDGEEYFSVPIEDGGYKQLSKQYYEGNSYYHYLNTEKERMERLKVYSLEVFDNDLVGIQDVDENSMYGLFSPKHEQLSPYKYIELKEIDKILYGYTENGICKIDSLANEMFFPKTVKEVDEYTAGIVLASNKEGSKALVNYDGKFLSSYYKNIKKYNEDLFLFEKADFYGAIDKDGIIVVPAIFAGYRDIKSKLNDMGYTED